MPLRILKKQRKSSVRPYSKRLKSTNKQRTLQIETNESSETTFEETGEISNPNDEIPVTYQIHQLQRRYRVNEEIRSVTPVVLVAQEFPAEPD